MMTIQVSKPGLLTTIQDSGRFGYQKYGVIVGGAMDPTAYRIANMLVGNDASAASLEITVMGPTLTFHEPALIAICGADFGPVISGEELPMWRPVWVEAGRTLRFGAAKRGVRAYLAIAGGLSVPKPMNSYSTYLRAGIGGLEGRALKAGDGLQTYPMNERNRGLVDRLKREPGTAASYVSVPWQVSRELIPPYRLNPVVRVLPGKQYDSFAPASRADLLREPFTVQPQSDRMGYRLSGAELRLQQPEELLSEPVTFGTIQVPADGQPIVLMADRQTTGGYHKIAQVISADLPLLAQAQIGSRISFKLVGMEEAQQTKMMLDLSLSLLQMNMKMYAR